MYNKVKDKTNANYYVIKPKKKLQKSANEQNEQKLVFLYFCSLCTFNFAQ